MNKQIGKSGTSPRSSVSGQRSAVGGQRSAIGRAGMFLTIGILLVGALVACQGRGALSPRARPQTPGPQPTATSTRPAPTPTPVPATATVAPTPTVFASATATAQPTSSGPSYPGRLVVRGADGLLYVVNADGTRLRQLTDGIDPSWSPDGRRIAFVRWREPWGLYIIKADGSGEQRINPDKHLRSPAWAPQGNVIATLLGRLEDIPPQVITIPGWGTFIISPGGEVWLHVLKAVNPDTGAYEGDYPADAFILSPSWAPDGRHLAYDGDRGIYITALGETPRLLTPDLAEANSVTPDWSPRGDRIAYGRWMHDHWEIWSMDTAGGDKRRLTPAGTRIGEKTYNSVAPAWSPDGRYIAFLTDRAGKWQVYVMRADGTGQRKLLDLPVKYEFNGERVLDWTR